MKTVYTVCSHQAVGYIITVIKTNMPYKEHISVAKTTDVEQILAVTLKM